MKNYYELLEISENASQEVVEKVYKLFAKKYHPDMNPDNAQEAEEKFKEITEAYEVLSDDFKRKEYDNKLKAERMIKETKVSSVNNTYKPQQDININKMTNEEVEQIKKQFEEMQNAEAERQRLEKEYEIKKAYNDAYVAALERMGVKVIYKKTWKEKWAFIKTLTITIVLFLLICFIIWKIPFTHDRLIEIYEGNAVLKRFVDLLTK